MHKDCVMVLSMHTYSFTQVIKQQQQKRIAMTVKTWSSEGGKNVCVRRIKLGIRIQQHPVCNEASMTIIVSEKKGEKALKL